MTLEEKRQGLITAANNVARSFVRQLREAEGDGALDGIGVRIVLANELTTPPPDGDRYIVSVERES